MAVTDLRYIPGEHTIPLSYVPTISAGTDKKYPVAIVPFDCTVVDVKIIYQAAVTGADTNTFTAEILNGGSGGTGTTIVASKAYTNGVNAAAYVPEALTNSSTAANLNLTKDDVLLYNSNQAGTGINDTEKSIVITIKAR